MMAERWRDALGDIASARRHFEGALDIGDRAAGDIGTREGYEAAMALQHAMLAGYTSFELAIKRTLFLLSEELPVGPDWHATLLRRISQPLPGMRPAMLGPQLYKAALELMRFRHVAMHAYDSFDFDRAAFALRAAEIFLSRIDDEFAAFRAAIDPD